MKLNDYLDESGLSLSQFAALLDESPQRIGWYVRNKTVPRPLMMQKIIRATNGKVALHDFYNIKINGHKP